MGENEINEVFEKIYDSKKTISAIGTYNTETGKGLLNKFLTLFIKIPKSKVTKPVRLQILRNNNQEFWNREFNGTKFNSTFTKLNNEKYLEKFSIFEFYFDILFDKDVIYKSEEIKILKIPISKFIKIKSNNIQTNKDEWYFEVIISAQNESLIFKYFGNMKIEY